MQIKMSAALRTAALFAALAFAGLTLAQDSPANVAGTWNISISGGSRSASQTISLTQDGGKISGTFKGPRQSGPLTGTVEGNAIKFHVAARVPLDYEGTVAGDSMKGTMTGKGQTADWTASRSK